MKLILVDLFIAVNDLEKNLIEGNVWYNFGMLFIVCTIIVIWFVFLALKPEKDKNANSNNVEQKQTYLTPEEIEKYYEETKEISKRQEDNDSDYYDSPYDIDFEDAPFRRTEKIYALHEEAPEELDDYYDEEESGDYF